MSISWFWYGTWVLGYSGTRILWSRKMLLLRAIGCSVLCLTTACKSIIISKQENLIKKKNNKQNKVIWCLSEMQMYLGICYFTRHLWNLLECRLSSPTWDPLNQDLHCDTQVWAPTSGFSLLLCLESWESVTVAISMCPQAIYGTISKSPKGLVHVPYDQVAQGHWLSTLQRLTHWTQKRARLLPWPTGPWRSQPCSPLWSPPTAFAPMTMHQFVCQTHQTYFHLRALALATHASWTHCL